MVGAPRWHIAAVIVQFDKGLTPQLADFFEFLGDLTRPSLRDMPKID
jgi:hypothetical protein